MKIGILISHSVAATLLSLSHKIFMVNRSFVIGNTILALCFRCDCSLSSQKCIQNETEQKLSYSYQFNSSQWFWLLNGMETTFWSFIVLQSSDLIGHVSQVVSGDTGCNTSPRQTHLDAASSLNQDNFSKVNFGICPQVAILLHKLRKLVWCQSPSYYIYIIPWMSITISSNPLISSLNSQLVWIASHKSIFSFR